MHVCTRLCTTALRTYFAAFNVAAIKHRSPYPLRDLTSRRGARSNIAVIAQGNCIVAL